MRKRVLGLFLSTFAVSLIHSPVVRAQTEAIDDFLGLESELLPELKGEQRFTTFDFHQKEDWKVTAKDVEVDVAEPVKGQNYSIIPWKTQDPQEFLSIEKWLRERDIKDKSPDWKIRLRQTTHQELLGRVLKCVGKCEVYRGLVPTEAVHFSQIFEGDEFHTGKDSSAWIFLTDGSLFRLSAETSISFQEFNIGNAEFYFLVRLNQGHAFWHPRSKLPLAFDDSSETDPASLPLMVREANKEYFERKIFEKQKDHEHLSEIMKLDENAVKKQFAEIERFKSELSSLFTFSSRLVLVAPNATVVSKNTSLDAVALPGGNFHFKPRIVNESDNIQLQLRGYASNQVHAVTANEWYEVNSLGRTYSKLSTLDVPSYLQILELLTKRIVTIELAREIWTKKYTYPLMLVMNSPIILARHFGYYKWGSELDRRHEFLLEYSRRVETTNLKAIENLEQRLAENGEVLNPRTGEDYYRASLNHYLLGLKSRYDNSKMKIREMNDLQYYVWILKNGKF